MKTLKSLSDIANLHDLRSIPRTRKSAKPQLSTTAILELSMARNERERLLKERSRLLKRGKQINSRLIEIEKEMDSLLKQARKKITEIRGKVKRLAGTDIKKNKRGRAKMIIEY